MGKELWKLFCEILRFLLGIAKKYPTAGINRLSVTVVIPAYNEEEHIAETIRSIQEQTHPVNRILVVDDYSDDRTGEVARRAGAEVVRTPRNSGRKARALNYGLQFVDTNATITVDADTTLAPDAIEKVLPPLLDPKVASVCGFVLPRKVETIWERARFIEYLVGICLNKEAENLWGCTMISSGCFSAFMTKNLRDFGGWPERNILEDIDLTWQHYEAGLKVVLVPEVKCYVISPPNYQKYQTQMDRWIRGGWLQNISTHKRKIFKNKRLAAFVYGSLAETLLALPLTIILFPIFIFHFGLWETLATAVVLEVTFMTALTSWAGWREGRLSLAIKCLPCYWLIRPVNIYLFWRSVWKEWILNQRLEDWTKGH